MIVAITGANGFIGSNMVKTVLEHGNDVIAIVRNDCKKNLPDTGVTTLSIDLLNDNPTTNLKCDLFYHFAWIGVNKNERSKSSIQTKNIDLSKNALKLAKKMNAKKFIGIGSQAEYGPYDGIIDESTPVNPNDPYGCTKNDVHNILQKCCLSTKLSFCWARIFSLFGAGDSPYSLISYLNRCIHDNTKPSINNSSTIWNFMYVKDACELLYRIGCFGVNNVSYPIGSCSNRSLSSFIYELESAYNSNLGFIDYKIHNGNNLRLNPQKTYDYFNFKEKYSFKDAVIDMKNEQEPNNT